MFDLFGLGKDIRSAPESGASRSGEEARIEPRNARRFWSRLLLLNGLLIAGFGAALFLRVQNLSQRAAQPQLPVRAQRPSNFRPKNPAPSAPKSPAPPIPEKAAPSPAPSLPPMPKGPIGSPSVNAPDLPQRGTPTLEGSKAAAAKAAPAIGASQVKVTSKPGSHVKAVDFLYTDASAQKVFLLGPFLVHGHGRKELVKNSDGTWEATIYLNAGTSYHYRFEITDKRGKKTLTPRISLALD